MMDFPAPSLNGNTYLDDGMVVRFSPDGVAVPIGYVNDSDDDAKRAVRDFLAKNGVPVASNFHDGLEWRVLHFVASAPPSSLSLPERAATYLDYTTARSELLTNGFRLPLPVELVGALSSSGESLKGLRTFVQRYDSDISATAAILTGLSVSADGVTVSEGGRNFVYSKSVFGDSVRDDFIHVFDFRLGSDFHELLYGRRLVDSETAEVHQEVDSELFAHYSGGSFTFMPQLGGSAFNYNAFSVLVRPKSEGDKSFSIQRF